MVRLNRLPWKVQAQKRKPQREDFRNVVLLSTTAWHRTAEVTVKMAVTLQADRFDDGILAASLSVNSTGTRAFCSVRQV